MATGKPTLHHLNDSQSMRILWLIEELEIDYDLKLYERQKSGPNERRAPDELKEVHMLGKSPILVTAEGRTIVETGAIANYLLRTYDTKKQFQGDPATGNDQIRDDILRNHSDTSFSVTFIIQMLFEVIADRSPFFVRPLIRGMQSMLHKGFTGPEFERSFKFLEKELGDQDYFMGSNPGRADFMLSWPMDNCVQRKYIDFKNYPALGRWHNRCKDRDGWKRAISKGNSYNLAF